MKLPRESLSIFLPVYNEAEVLPGVIERALAALESIGLPHYELIVVDDGSSDASGAIADAAQAANPRVRAIHHEHNRGYGAALVSGFEAARYEWTAYTDGDGQFDLKDIARFFDPATRVDVVLGYRLKRNDHAGRRLNAWLWSWLVRLILGLKVRDLDCGFKLFRTERLRKLGSLNATGAVISAELLSKLKAAGCSWEEVGVEHYPRMGGAPSGAKPGVIVRAIRELWQLRQSLGRA